ncbi:P-II family nitrogen regulator [Paenibacillus validus]|uniref:P-II family nitrogen regulator n=1 Tax=Paenibacillus validus TaxID=44253 RepID=A0A7X3CRS9_9BACL|nr:MULTISPECIES: P-II family nitrogen regulator [Paenibacillus]MED4600863.1 P-II family nitrogen regulator [Paenibacillus validus]MED4606635.1 P-II family nitrogen regulator [Paenibacillus validus]MUG70016.1 P-II family nitrogen regulator [Paenibacillus validus]
MKLLTIIVRPEKISNITAALYTIGVTGMTISDVRGHGIQKGVKTIYRGVEYQTDFVTKCKIETVVNDAIYEKAIEVIIDASRTGQVGDGKIFVTEVLDVIRIRTGQHGQEALDQ